MFLFIQKQRYSSNCSSKTSHGSRSRKSGVKPTVESHLMRQVIRVKQAIAVEISSLLKVYSCNFDCTEDAETKPIQSYSAHSLKQLQMHAPF